LSFSSALRRAPSGSDMAAARPISQPIFDSPSKD